MLINFVDFLFLFDSAFFFSSSEKDFASLLPSLSLSESAAVVRVLSVLPLASPIESSIGNELKGNLHGVLLVTSAASR
jgi:hypothetical protein